MPYEELKGEKLYAEKLSMYEEEAHDRKIAKDSGYTLGHILESNTANIAKAKELLDKVSKELFEAGLDIKDWQILKEYV